MQQLSTLFSTGNVRGLSRSQSDVQESLQIVPDITHDSFVYDSFAFLVDDMDGFVDVVPKVYRSSTCVGTGTLSCFKYDNKLLGGLLVSLPLNADNAVSVAEKVYNGYVEKFGDRLVETVDSGVEDSYVSAEGLSSEDVGLDSMDVTVLNTVADEMDTSNVPIYTFGFVSEDTVNLLYLLSEDAYGGVERYRSVVRQLDTMAVFESPQSRFEVEGTAFVPCERVLSSPKFQSYLESEYVLSEEVQFNLGNLDSPEVYVDSVLGFKFTPQFSSGVSVSVCGSRNASSIERRVRQVMGERRQIEVEDFVSIKSGVLGKRRDTGESVFVGQCYVDWACDCEAQVCPTVVTISSESSLDKSDIKSVDSLLQETEGRKPFEVPISGLEVEAFTQA